MSHADSRTVADRLMDVRLIAMDVDGVLTDGTITFTPGAESESKTFHVADGLGIQLAVNAGLSVVWITGRASEVVERRAIELGVSRLYQNAANKSAALADAIGAYQLAAPNTAYIGDDLNDLPAFALAGVKFAPSNAMTEVKAVADFVTERPGGAGAVREVCDAILKAQGRWNDALTTYLAGLLAK